MEKINILQFLPYFPPRDGWIQTVAQSLSKFYIKNWLWIVFNLTFWVWQEKIMSDQNLKSDRIFYKNNKIWYKKQNYEVIVLPAFDIVYNYPFPKFRSKDFWLAFAYLKTKKIDKPLYYIVCETKEGNWGIDKEGLSEDSYRKQLRRK